MMQRGRPRQQSTLWTSRKRKCRHIKRRLESGESYTEADGTVWRYRDDLSHGLIRTPVQVGNTIWDDLDTALEAQMRGDEDESCNNKS